MERNRGWTACEEGFRATDRGMRHDGAILAASALIAGACLINPREPRCLGVKYTAFSAPCPEDR